MIERQVTEVWVNEDLETLILKTFNTESSIEVKISDFIKKQHFTGALQKRAFNFPKIYYPVMFKRKGNEG